MTLVSEPQPEVAAGIEPDELVVWTTRQQRYARIQQLEEITAALRAGTWARQGYRSPHAWLSHLTGESRGQVSITLTLAERLEHLRSARMSFEGGHLSESALLLLARAWAPHIADVYTEAEEMLVEWGTRLPYPHFKVLVDAWVARVDTDRNDQAERTRHDRRRMVLSETLDGMWHGEFTLDPEAGRLLNAAIQYLSRPAAHDDRTPTQRRADALTTLAKHFPAPSDGGEAEPARPGPTRRIPKLIATFDWKVLTSGRGVGTLETNYDLPTPISAAALQRLACDAGIHRYIANAPDLRVHYGRTTRTVSPHLFDLLALRDHGCRWPGCTAPAAFTEAHHADHWHEHDGPTDPDNLLLLCWHHHHLLHEQRWRIWPLGAGHFQLQNPQGTIVETLRPPTIGPDTPAVPRPLSHDGPDELA